MELKRMGGGGPGWGEAVVELRVAKQIIHILFLKSTGTVGPLVDWTKEDGEM